MSESYTTFHNSRLSRTETLMTWRRYTGHGESLRSWQFRSVMWGWEIWSEGAAWPERCSDHSRARFRYFILALLWTIFYEAWLMLKDYDKFCNWALTSLMWEKTHVTQFRPIALFCFRLSSDLSHFNRQRQKLTTWKGWSSDAMLKM